MVDITIVVHLLKTLVRNSENSEYDNFRNLNSHFPVKKIRASSVAYHSVSSYEIRVLPNQVFNQTLIRKLKGKICQEMYTHF